MERIIGIMDMLYDNLMGFIASLVLVASTLVWQAIVIILVVITLPIWIIPYHIYKIKKE